MNDLSPVPSKPPSKLNTSAKPLAVEPVSILILLPAVPATEAVINILALLAEALTPILAALISSLKLITVFAILEPVPKKNKLPEATSAGILLGPAALTSPPTQTEPLLLKLQDH